VRIKIDAGGRAVEIECSDTNVSPDTVGDKALQLWKETEGAVRPSEGPAYGFQAQVASAQRTTQALAREQPPVKTED
jgi:hypothetical protein